MTSPGALFSGGWNRAPTCYLARHPADDDWRRHRQPPDCSLQTASPSNSPLVTRLDSANSVPPQLGSVSLTHQHVRQTREGPFDGTVLATRKVIRFFGMIRDCDASRISLCCEAQQRNVLWGTVLRKTRKSCETKLRPCQTSGSWPTLTGGQTGRETGLRSSARRLSCRSVGRLLTRGTDRRTFEPVLPLQSRICVTGGSALLR